MPPSGLTPALLFEEILLSIIFCAIGLLVMYAAFSLVARKIDLRKELIEDENVALAIMFAGFFVAVAVIVASAIR